MRLCGLFMRLLNWRAGVFPYFELFGRTIGLYPIMALIGAFAAGLYTIREGKKQGLDSNDTIEALLVICAGVLVGGHLLYALTNAWRFPAFFANLYQLQSFEDFINAILPIFGGAVFYGGLFGGLLAGLIYGRRKRLDAKAYADIMASSAPLFHAFGRIGCFLGGCCYGIESRVGFTFRRALIPEANFVQRFPVQLLEALFNVALFFVFRRILSRDILRGHLFALYLLAYAAGRFLLEFLRGDAIRGALFGVSASQWISAVVIIVASVYFIRIRRTRTGTLF